jgi:hypothetical protein
VFTKVSCGMWTVASVRIFDHGSWITEKEGHEGRSARRMFILLYLPGKLLVNGNAVKACFVKHSNFVILTQKHSSQLCRSVSMHHRLNVCL